MYDSVEQAHLRLGGCVVMYKGHARYVDRAVSGRDARGEWRATDICLRLVTMTPGRDYEYISLADPELQYTKLRTGYFNMPDRGAALLTRRPTRTAKQALSSENSNIRYVTDLRIDNIHTSHVHALTLSDGVSDATPAAKALYDGLYRGEYPTLPEALARIEELKRAPQPRRNSAHSVAISRSMCLVHEPDLEMTYVQCRGDLIGMYVKASGLVLPSPKSFYKEEAQVLFPKITINSEAA